jgi:hypothetical protein
MAETEIPQRKDDGKIKRQGNDSQFATVGYHYLTYAIFPNPLGSHYGLTLKGLKIRVLNIFKLFFFFMDSWDPCKAVNETIDR